MEFRGLVMRTIEIPESLFDALAQHAEARGVTTQELLEVWLAEDSWAEHATRAFDQYVPGTGQIYLSDDEFLASLHDVPSESEESDANVRADS